MPALDEHVGGHHHPAVRGQHDGGVVAGTDRHTGRMSPPGNQPVDHGELPDLVQCEGVPLLAALLTVVDHAPSTPAKSGHCAAVT